MNILFIGDVFGKPGRRAVFECLPRLVEGEQIHFVIANGENMAGGKGLTPETCRQFFDAGVDVITTGNHVRDKKEIDTLLNTDARILRPLNYADTVPGRGWTVGTSRTGSKVAVLNSMGRVHIADVESPFHPTRTAADELRKETPVVILDFHAEATSEKRAMGWWLNGHVSAVLGTHTHVQTADEEILSGGTAYITDVGMTGPHNSVIGLRTDLAMERFLAGTRGRFDVGKGDVRFCGVLVDVDPESGRARSIRRVRQDCPNL